MILDHVQLAMPAGRVRWDGLQVPPVQHPGFTDEGGFQQPDPWVGVSGASPTSSAPARWDLAP